MQTNIIVKTQFEAIHCWSSCPFSEVAFLKQKHRHIFHVTCKAAVMHDDRAIEFIMCKHELEKFLTTTFHQKDIGDTSCEMLCKKILAVFHYFFYVCIEEDGENGAEVWRTRDENISFS